MSRLKATVSILILAIAVSACGTGEQDKAVPPTPPEQDDKAETHKDKGTVLLSALSLPDLLISARHPLP